MKRLTVILLLLVSLFAKGQLDSTKFVIERFQKLKGNYIYLMHEVEPFIYSGWVYRYHGLSRPFIAIGDTAVLHQPTRRVHHQWVTIIPGHQEFIVDSFIRVDGQTLSLFSHNEKTSYNCTFSSVGLFSPAIFSGDTVIVNPHSKRHFVTFKHKNIIQTLCPH